MRSTGPTSRFLVSAFLYGLLPASAFAASPYQLYHRQLDPGLGLPAAVPGPPNDALQPIVEANVIPPPNNALVAAPVDVVGNPVPPPPLDPVPPPPLDPVLPPPLDPVPPPPLDPVPPPALDPVPPPPLDPVPPPPVDPPQPPPLDPVLPPAGAVSGLDPGAIGTDIPTASGIEGDKVPPGEEPVEALVPSTTSSSSVSSSSAPEHPVSSSSSTSSSSAADYTPAPSSTPIQSDSSHWNGTISTTSTTSLAPTETLVFNGGMEDPTLDAPCYNASCQNPDSHMNYVQTITVSGDDVFEGSGNMIGAGAWLTMAAAAIVGVVSTVM